jgi:hypothetical protein
MNSQTLGELSLSPLLGGAFVAHVPAEAREQLAAWFAVYTSAGHQAQILECRDGQRTQLGHLVAPILSATPDLAGHAILMRRPATIRQSMICQVWSGRPDVDLWGAMAYPALPSGEVVTSAVVFVPRERRVRWSRRRVRQPAPDIGLPCQKRLSTKNSEGQVERAIA